MSDLIAEYDRRGLIRESYRIEGIQAFECRSIFLDWALFDEHAEAQKTRIKTLLDHYGAADPEHPMTEVLRGAYLADDTPKGRRGGRRGRLADEGKSGDA